MFVTQTCSSNPSSNGWSAFNETKLMLNSGSAGWCVVIKCKPAVIGLRTTVLKPGSLALPLAIFFPFFFIQN